MAVSQKMLINEKKTNTIIFNSTQHYQLAAKLSKNDKDIEVIDGTWLVIWTYYSK